LRIAILGAGAGGLGMAIRLKQSGFHDFTIFEKSDGVGGTWRDNTYPGAACDVMAHLYSYSFEPKLDWSRTFPEQVEILDYLERCADKYGVRPHLRCNCAVEEIRWDEERSAWIMRTAGGTHEANVVISALGMLNVPKYPDIPGLDGFAGPVFHTARWDHSCDLRGRAVGLIGTGASAIQVGPRIAPDVERLTVFQRSPGWVVPKLDRAYTDREKRLFRTLPPTARLLRWRIYWRSERSIGLQLGDPRAEARRKVALRHIEAQIPEPELRRRVTPDYALGCKRMLITNDWYPMLCRPNVDLVTDSIARIELDGAITESGARHHLDVIILATGFYATDHLKAIEVYGAGGRRLRDEWSAGGAQAYLGMTVAGYPNLFLLYGPNTNQGGNSIIFILESQFRYIVGALRLLARRGIRRFEVRQPVMRAFNDRLQHVLKTSMWEGGCTSYFRSVSGRITTQWPIPSWRYWALTRRFAPRDFELGAQRSAVTTR
jgi:cation diffusion facilitator CzcD-associated flavoprotein CzcO